MGKKNNNEETTETEKVDVSEDSNEEISNEEIEKMLNDEADAKEEENTVAKLTQRLEDEENKYLKLLAEFENFKRRNKQEAETRNKYKEQKLAEDLLPVLDNLERALSVDDDAEAFSSLKKGVDMVHKEFVKVFNNHEVTVIEAVGVEFDPNVHQAVMTEADDSVESNMVIEEFQKGYMLKDRVIRPSMVKVSE